MSPLSSFQGVAGLRVKPRIPPKVAFYAQIQRSFNIVEERRGALE